ncbi:MAG: class I SAM-dependent methyltransferase [Candidatus Omnitrophica bacterium]|nr:class I SAM-dependent methyltransferase [Candidatus Omnitrophota bacterium]
MSLKRAEKDAKIKKGGTTLLERIRPRDLRQRLQKLHKEEFARLKKKYPVIEVKRCIACQGRRLHIDFFKLGFPYVRCRDCNTVFLSRRFPNSAIIDYFSNSKAESFWANEILPRVERERYINIAKPKCGLIKERIFSVSGRKKFNIMVEVGAGTGTLRKAFMRDKFAGRYDCIEPSISACRFLKRQNWGEVFCCSLDLFLLKESQKYPLALANGVIEHPSDLRVFFKDIAKILEPQGYLALSSSGADGLDSLVIPGGLPNAWPPHVQNFLSKRGLECLGKSAGLKMLLYESIGKLDVDLLYEYAKDNSIAYVRNWSVLLEDPDFRKDFQGLLARYNKSGFYLAIFKKI